MTTAPQVRPMTIDDVAEGVAMTMASFADLGARLGRPDADNAPNSARTARFEARMRNFVTHDAAGCWVHEEADGRIDGVSNASRRGTLWGLALLAVRPGAQAQGLGKALLDAALTYAEGTTVGVICASDDTRALRRYALAGFRLYPSYECADVPILPSYEPDSHVTVGAMDVDFAAEVDLAVRGAERGPDYALLDQNNARWIRYEDGPRRGYAVVDAEYVKCVAGTDEAVAAALLRAALAGQAADRAKTSIGALTAGQRWAIDVALEARLPLLLTGSTCWRGRDEPRAYLPNGALL